VNGTLNREIGMGFWTRKLAGRAKALAQFFGALADLADGRHSGLIGLLLDCDAGPTSPPGVLSR
jgi:hypothetical protein